MKKENYVLVAGLFGVAAATSLSLLFSNIWIGIFSAVIVSIVYLFFLDKWMIQKLQPSGTRKTVRYLIGFLVVLQLYALGYHVISSSRQYDNLMTIRTTIENSIAQLETEQTLIEALRHYHHEADKENRTVASSFIEVTGDRFLEDTTLLPITPANSPALSYTAEIPNPDSVFITVTSDVAWGTNTEFVNLGSEIGKYQAKAILTAKGVSYEREN
ncbi:MAG: hypothetical protein WD059_00565 [Balneolaceae bacterium]